MTLQQEAYNLIQEQPESNLKIIIDLLKALRTANLSNDNKSDQVFSRTGVGKDVIKMSDASVKTRLESMEKKYAKYNKKKKGA